MLDNHTEADDEHDFARDRSTGLPGDFRAVAHFLSEEELEDILSSSSTPLESRKRAWGEALVRMAESQESQHHQVDDRSPALIGTLQAIRAWHEKQARQKAQAEAFAAFIKAEKQRKRRAAKKVLPPDPLEVIEKEFRERLDSLNRVVFSKLRHKRLEQIRGRELHYALIWKAQQLARLKYGAKASADRVAEEAKPLLGDPTFNRHKARNALQVIGRLENAGQPWRCFKAVSESSAPTA